MGGIVTALAWAGGLLLAAHASGCILSEEPPKPEPKRPEPPQPTGGVEAQEKLQEFTGATRPKPVIPFAVDEIGFLSLSGDRVSETLSEICPGVHEALAKDKATLTPEIMERGLESYYSGEIIELQNAHETNLDREISLKCKVALFEKTNVIYWLTLAVSFHKKNYKLKKAEKTYELAKAVGKLGGNLRGIGYAFLGLAHINFDRSDHGLAIKYFNEAIRHAPELEMAERIWKFLEDSESWLAAEDREVYYPPYRQLAIRVRDVKRRFK